MGCKYQRLCMQKTVVQAATGQFGLNTLSGIHFKSNEKELKPGKNACCKLDVYLPNGHFLPPLPFLLAPTGCLDCIS